MAEFRFDTIEEIIEFAEHFKAMTASVAKPTDESSGANPASTVAKETLQEILQDARDFENIINTEPRPGYLATVREATPARRPDTEPKSITKFADPTWKRRHGRFMAKCLKVEAESKYPGAIIDIFDAILEQEGEPSFWSVPEDKWDSFVEAYKELDRRMTEEALASGEY